MVVIHLFWLINQSGQLISRISFTAPALIGELGIHPDSQITLSSLLFSVCGVSQEITPRGNPMESMPMHLVEMEEHNIHIYETPTGLKMVLITDCGTKSCPPSLWHDLHMVYVSHALKNPFHTVDATGIGQPIRIPAFAEAIKKAVEKYASPLPAATVASSPPQPPPMVVGTIVNPPVSIPSSSAPSSAPATS